VSTPEPRIVLRASSLVREFGALVAVNGVDLELAAGEFLTIFGPNGAGKTTLLSLLGGKLRPSSGEVRVADEPLDFGATSWRSRIGILSHQGMLYAHLTVAENLRFFGRLFGLEDLEERIPERLEQVGLADRADFLARQLSHGMRQRLALARALLHDPDLVLLDEPYTGLDPYAASVLRGVLASLKDGHRTVVMVTHNLGEGLELSDRVAIQVRGRFAWEGRRADIDVDDFEHHYHRGVENGRP
jgi:heme exporter protein A